MKNNRIVKASIYSIKNELVSTLIFMALSYFLGMIVWLVITNVTSDVEEGIITLGSIMAMAIGFISVILLGACSMRSRFNLAVGMSFTRKEFIICESISAALVTICVLILGAIMYFAEARIFNGIIPGMTVSSDLERFISSLYTGPFILLLVSGVMALRAFTGYILLKYKEKGIVVLIALYWGSTMLLYRAGAGSIGERLINVIVRIYKDMALVSVNLPPLVGIVVLLIITYLVSIGIRRQEVV